MSLNKRFLEYCTTFASNDLYMTTYIWALVILLLPFSCKREVNKFTEKRAIHIAPKQVEVKKDTTEIAYEKIQLDSAKGLKIENFYITTAYRLYQNYVVTGNKVLSDSTFSSDWFVLLDSKRRIIYEMSVDMDELYVFKPSFYKSVRDNRIVAVVGTAYEYTMGGYVYVIDGNKVTYAGYIDATGAERETEEASFITDVLTLKGNEKRISFYFSTDSILLGPGDKNILVKNRKGRTRYEYDFKQLVFIR